MSIDKKLLLGFGVILALVLVVAAFSAVSLSRIAKVRQKVLEERQHIEVVMELRIKLSRMAHKEMDFLLFPGNKEVLEEYEQSKREFEELKEKGEAILKRKGEERIVKNINDLYLAYTNFIDQQIKLVKEGKIEEARKMEMEQAEVKFEALTEFLKEHEESSAGELERVSNELSKEIVTSQRLAPVTPLLVFAIGMVVAIIFRRLIQQIQFASLQITSAVSQIHTLVAEEATGAQEQSSSISEVASTLAEFASSAANIDVGAEDVAKQAEKTLIGIQEVNTKIEGTAKKMLSLGQRSTAIGNITSLIDDIAEQTNLLALNAAIEAARVGEQGRGFAVVASEIRKLAERSAESTTEIRSLITDIQNEISSTILGMEESTKWMQKGLEMIKETTTIAKEISFATRQQISASQQTFEAMQSISAVAKQFASSIKQTAASATQLNKLAQELKVVIGGLKRGESRKS